jgi:hypothetical protein
MHEKNINQSTKNNHQQTLLFDESELNIPDIISTIRPMNEPM